MSQKIPVYDTDTRALTMTDVSTLGGSALDGSGTGVLTGTAWNIARERVNGAGLDLSPLIIVNDDESQVTISGDLSAVGRFFGGFLPGVNALGIMRGADVPNGETAGLVVQSAILEADDNGGQVRIHGTLILDGDFQDINGNPKVAGFTGDFGGMTYVNGLATGPT